MFWLLLSRLENIKSNYYSLISLHILLFHFSINMILRFNLSLALCNFHIGTIHRILLIPLCTFLYYIWNILITWTLILTSKIEIFSQYSAYMIFKLHIFVIVLKNCRKLRCEKKLMFKYINNKGFFFLLCMYWYSPSNLN